MNGVQCTLSLEKEEIKLTYNRNIEISKERWG